VYNMFPIPFGPGIHLCNTTQFSLYRTEDISITKANGSMLFKEIIIIFPDNHAKPQNAFHANTKFFLYVTACGAYSSHCASDSLCHFQFMAKRNCQRLSSFQLPELQSSATLSV
jgi:hypothetical protein